MKGDERARRRGSGVGIANVNKRIRLRFGMDYGIMIDSEPDEGTKVIIHIPAVPYNEENQKLMEEGASLEDIRRQEDKKDTEERREKE